MGKMNDQNRFTILIGQTLNFRTFLNPWIKMRKRNNIDVNVFVSGRTADRSLMTAYNILRYRKRGFIHQENKKEGRMELLMPWHTSKAHILCIVIQAFSFDDKFRMTYGFSFRSKNFFLHKPFSQRCFRYYELLNHKIRKAIWDQGELPLEF